MLDFLKGKKKDDDSTSTSDNTAEDVNTDDGGDKSQQSDDVVDGVPVKLSEKLAEIRGDVERDIEYHELDDDGKVKKDDDGNPIVVADADEDEISAAKDGDTSSGDANDTLSASEKDESVAEANTDNSEDGRVTLDTRLEEAGRKMGWTDDKIISVAQTDITILEDLADRFEKDDIHRQDVVVKDGEDARTGDSKLSDEDVTKLREKLGDAATDIILNMKKENENLSSKLDVVDKFTADSKANIERQNEARRCEIASELFDNNTEAFPEFGTTDKLPVDAKGVITLNSPQIVARDKVYQVAKMFQAKNGGNFSTAMSEALNWHAGSTGTVNAQRQVVKDLNDRKKRFSPRPSRRKMVKVFKTPQAKGANIVAEAKKAAGIT